MQHTTITIDNLVVKQIPGHRYIVGPELYRIDQVSPMDALQYFALPGHHDWRDYDLERDTGLKLDPMTKTIGYMLENIIEEKLTKDEWVTIKTADHNERRNFFCEKVKQMLDSRAESVA